MFSKFTIGIYPHARLTEPRHCQLDETTVQPKGTMQPHSCTGQCKRIVHRPLLSYSVHICERQMHTNCCKCTSNCTSMGHSGELQMILSSCSLSCRKKRLGLQFMEAMTYISVVDRRNNTRNNDNCIHQKWAGHAFS